MNIQIFFTLIIILVSHSITDAQSTFENVDSKTENLRVPDDERSTIPRLTKYEKVRILGTRIKQISDGSKIFVKSKDIKNASSIADLELKHKVIPLKIKEYLNMFQDKIYSTCFYQWFGYQSVYLYNYLYNEDCFNYLHFSVSDLFELENMIKDFDFIRKEDTIVVQNKRLLLFLDEIISIKQPCLENEHFVISKLRTQKENEKIIEI